MGAATCFVAEEQGRVAGTLGTMVRRLLLPDGREEAVAYFGDLKVGPAARKGHLSFFARQNPAVGAALIRLAMRQAGRAGHPALFVSVAVPDVAPLHAALGSMEKVIAPATIYGNGLDESAAWNINSSEM
jgi:hypothetical protein